jgi:hypothetical protein
LWAQAPYEFGYVITNKGDTVFGKIKDRKFVTDPGDCDDIILKINFTDSSEKKIHYTPYDIKKYCKKGTLFFYSLPVGFENKLKFCELLVDGEVILFGFVNNTQAFTANDLSTKIKEKTQKKDQNSNIEHFLQRKGKPGSLMKVKRKTFIETVTFFFQDNAGLVQKIENKEYKYTDLETLVKLYNESKKQTK